MMPAEDSLPNPQSAHAPSPSDVAAAAFGDTPAKAVSRPIPGSPRFLWLWALAGGLAAGVASWLWGEATFHYFEPAIVLPPNYKDMNPYEKTDYLSNELRLKTPPAETKNTALAFGVLGSAVGLCLGVVGGVARRSFSATLLACAVGAVVGVVGTVAASAIVVPIFFDLVTPETGLLVPLLIHSALLLPIGAAAGLALGLGLGRHATIARTLMAGLCGALLGAVVFQLILATQFPLMRIQQPIPVEATPRTVMHLSAAGLIALSAGLAAMRRPRPTPNRPRTS